MRGLVASTDRRASAAGASLLRQGGNAADAAVAAALVLYVVEPQSAGVGGDGFFIWGEPGRTPAALDGSGAMPLGLTREHLETDGLEQPPGRGARSVTVPGALSLLEACLDRFGTATLADTSRPAIRLARDGFEVGPLLATATARAAGALASDPVLSALYLPGGHTVEAGARLCNPRLADLLEEVSTSGASVFYTGAIADALVERVAGAGGYLSQWDLARHRTTERTLERCRFRRHDIWELPAPTQGPAVLASLRRLEERAPFEDDDINWQAVIEAVIEGMCEAGFDLRTMPGGSTTSARGDTTYVAAVDANGGTASLITSVFGDFGAHFGVDVIGGSLGNRAAILRLLRRDPVPGARPPHTTIPSMVTTEIGARFALGVAGGLMQPQAQVQLLLRILELGADPQSAVDAPRFRVMPGGELALEPGHPLGRRHPKAVGRMTGNEGFGAAQVGGFFDGAMLGAADGRRGGAVVFA